jgi:acetoin utilization deacetylase AcuC-like enzyme
MISIYHNFKKHLDDIKHRISPDIVLYDAGVDVFSGDGLGNLEVTREGIIKRDEIVLGTFSI